MLQRRRRRRQHAANAVCDEVSMCLYITTHDIMNSPALWLGTLFYRQPEIGYVIGIW